MIPALIGAAVLGTAPCHGLTDGTLCMPLPSGWHSSVGFGRTSRRPAAWMFAGNFRFPRDAAKREGDPIVPPHRVLISIGDFPLHRHPCGHWPRVRRLHLPRRPFKGRQYAWDVRYKGRALDLTVRFGSRSTPRARRLVNRRLASVRRIG